VTCGIALELYLKAALVFAIERVYEIGPDLPQLRAQMRRTDP